MTTTLALANLHQTDIPLGGGKAANLGELIHAGLNVPPGFVLTTAAYSHFVVAADLDELIHKWLTALDPADGALLHAAFATHPMPADLGEAIVRAYRELGTNVPVAVRSSATAEDLPGATFAGQQETYLNVLGEEALLTAVRSCWASLWTERATLYRNKQQVEQSTVKLAVVVQRMVMAEVAGVLFTANPITGERDMAVIDANPGLGEAVVSGAVTPDHFLVHKLSLAVRERRLGAREVEIRPVAAGGVEEVHGSSQTGIPALTDAQLGELTRLGLRIEKHYGAAQDIEWAYAEGQFYILQARPITALPAPAVTPPAQTTSTPARKKRRQRGPDPAEMFPIRPYPLDYDTHTSTLEETVLRSLGGPIGIKLPDFKKLLEVEDGVVIRVNPIDFGPSWRMIYQPLLSLWQRRKIDLRHWRQDPLINEAKARAQLLESQAFATRSWAELVQTMQDALALERFIGQLRTRYFLVGLREMGLLLVLLRLTGQHQHSEVLLAGSSNMTLLANQALEAMAATIRQSPTLHALFTTQSAEQLLETINSDQVELQEFWAQFSAFLAEYGSREAVITLMSQPTWKDAPQMTLGLLKNQVLAPAPAKPIDDAWQQVRDKLLAQSPLGKPPLRNFFLARLEQARQFVPMREDTHFYMTLPMPAERRCALEMGRRLTAVGVLREAEEIFHLLFAELQSIQEPTQLSSAERRALSDKVQRRQQRRAELADTPMFASTQDEIQNHDPAALLTGMGSSAGVVEGVVRIVNGPQDFEQLELGEVLVAPYTNPAWTPLFLRAVAVISDTGSPMSHAAIVAREYGIPAVLGAGQATRTLYNGQRVRVDGTKGLVYPA